MYCERSLDALLPSVFLRSGSLGNIVQPHRTVRQHADCSFSSPTLLFSFRAQHIGTLGEPFCSFLPSSVNALPQTPNT
ncbi:hypothetical protein H5410_003138 [Solanum commersonii]|uniref:Uncharacterized protein n=1 Tax=Solanum commersonii TaxID=4109 RepID=A0A9J6B3U8_SOLCO|nr:hypothetical protein H5410_003138 [Solanum commersonii]